MPKVPNPMSVRSVLTYTVEEAAEALGVTQATIRNYVKRGLPIMAQKRPALISGQDIQFFLRAERSARKRPMAKHELYCPSCRKGRRPYLNMVDLLHTSKGTALLTGLCECCDKTCNRTVSNRYLQAFADIFDISERERSTA